MFWICAALSAAGILEPVICWRVAGEWADYRLRQLLRTDRLFFVKRAGWPRSAMCSRTAAIKPMRTKGGTETASGRFRTTIVSAPANPSMAGHNLATFHVTFRLYNALDRPQRPVKGNAAL